MIDEPPALPADRVGSVVCAEWGVDVTHAEHLPVGAGAWHWRVGDDGGPQWFVTLDAVATAEERRDRLAAYDAATRLAQRLEFVVAPVYTRDQRVAVDVAPGLLLSITPYLEGEAGEGPFADDVERTPVAGLLGDLHALGRPRHLKVWRPRLGPTGTEREDLLACLRDPEWSGGPWSGPASRLLADSREAVEASLKRYALLAAAVSGSIDRWVVTHGEPHTGNVINTPDGPRLVDWESVALAPRERDLREVLGRAEGDEPWYAYLEAGGRPEALSPDTVELFDLQWHLGEIAEYAARFSRPHDDTADDRRCFNDLEHELGALEALVARWA